MKASGKISNPHNLIRTAINYLNTQSPRKYRDYPGLITTKSGMLDIRVTSKTKFRALRIMDTLVKEIYKLGGKIQFKNDETHLIISGVDIAFFIRERFKIYYEKESTTSRYSRRKFEATGKLYLSIGRYVSREFIDSVEKPLEDKIPNVIKHILKEVELMLACSEANRIRAEREEKERLERQRLEELKRQEEEKLTNLLSQVNNWHNANMIRSYLQEVKSRTAGTDPEWMKWAEDKADEIDPLVGS